MAGEADRYCASNRGEAVWNEVGVLDREGRWESCAPSYWFFSSLGDGGLLEADDRALLTALWSEPESPAPST
jgi:hypothetical protein